MDESLNTRPVWSLQQNIGEVHCGQLQARVDVAHPQHGLKQIGTNVPVAETLLSVRRAEAAALTRGSGSSATLTWPLPIADAYVRGSDLVATYQPVDAWPYAPQLYWRAGALDAIDGVESSISLWVSVQTPLLDTHPRISVVSRFTAEATLLAEISESGDVEVRPASAVGDITSDVTLCIIRRLPNSPLSYIEFVLGSDCSALDYKHASAGSDITEWQLFSEFLEKGVIRRARVQAAFIDRANDIELSLECCQAMRAAPLPLTT